MIVFKDQVHELEIIKDHNSNHLYPYHIYLRENVGSELDEIEMMLVMDATELNELLLNLQMYVQKEGLE